MMKLNKIYFGDNLQILKSLPSESIDLIYIDPPFNTGKTQSRTRIKTIKSSEGDRTGFQGNSYKTIELDTKSYFDSYGNEYLKKFLTPRLLESKRLLTSHGSFYFHIDYREVHYVKILLDQIFGRENFLNEIIWSYDFGGKSKSRWPPKHDNILFYVKNKDHYIFNTNKIDREPYMAPSLVGEVKAKRGKLPTDVWWYDFVGRKRITDTWWHSIVGTNSKERTGYPTQKPRRIIDRIIKASSLPGQTVMDFFAGSGTIGESCLDLDRKFILIDNNIEALKIMASRFCGWKNIEWVNFDPSPYKEDFYTLKKESLEKKKTYQDDFKYLLSSSSIFQKDLEDKNEMWKESPFEWVQELSAAQKGKLGRHLIKKWFESKGLKVKSIKKRGVNFNIGGLLIATKFSTLWSNGEYRFQQIRENGYDVIICLGISPYSSHCYVFEKDFIIKHATLQHGKSGSEYRFNVNPSNPKKWIKQSGGTLEEATKIIKKIIEIRKAPHD